MRILSFSILCLLVTSTCKGGSINSPPISGGIVSGSQIVNAGGVTNGQQNISVGGTFNGQGNFNVLPRWPKKMFFIGDSKLAYADTNPVVGWHNPGGYTNQFCTAYTNVLGVPCLSYAGGGFTYSNNGFGFSFPTLASWLQGQIVSVDLGLVEPGQPIASFGRGYYSWESIKVDQQWYNLTYNAQGTNHSLIYCDGVTGYTYHSFATATNDFMFEIIGLPGGNFWYTNIPGQDFSFTPLGVGSYYTVALYGTPGAVSTNVDTWQLFPANTSSFNSQFCPPYANNSFGNNNPAPLRWMNTNAPTLTGISAGVFIAGGGNDRIYSWQGSYNGNIINYTNGYMFTYSNIVYIAQYCKNLGYYPVIVSTYDIDPGFLNFTNTSSGFSLTNLIALNQQIRLLVGQTNVCDFVYDMGTFTLPVAIAEESSQTNYMTGSTSHWTLGWDFTILTNMFNSVGFNSSFLPATFAASTSTNTLVVTSTGLTNTTPFTYLITVTVGGSLVLKDQNGNQFGAPVVNDAFPLKPGWRLTGTTVTAQAYQLP